LHRFFVAPIWHRAAVIPHGLVDIAARAMRGKARSPSQRQLSSVAETATTTLRDPHLGQRSRLSRLDSGNALPRVHTSVCMSSS
jgi:hypothetical protein